MHSHPRLTQTIFTLTIVIAAIGVSSAEAAYRWVDAAGQVHYSDAPPKAGQAKSVEAKSLQASVVASENMPYALREAVKKNPVILYVAPDCGMPCLNGRQFLMQYGIPFTEKQVKTPEEFEHYKKTIGSEPVVPTLQVGSQARPTFEEGSWSTLLKAAQYPLEAKK